MTDSSPELDSAGRAAHARSDAITKALESVSGGETEAVATPQDEPSTPEPEGDAQQDQEFEADDDGQEPSDDASAADSEGQTDLETVEESTQFEAPKNWPQERREAFDALPDEAKNIILEREREINKGFTKQAQENADHRKFAESVRGQFTDADRRQMEAAGMSEPEAVGYFLQLNRMATQQPDRYLAGFLQSSRDPAGLVRAALQHLQMQPEQVFQSNQTDQTQGEGSDLPEEFADDPYFQQLQAQVNKKVEGVLSENQQLKEELNRIKQDYYGERQSRQQHAVHSLQQVVDEFRGETDDTGNAKFPHYDQLETAMVELMQSPSFNQQSFSSPREKLEAAYDRALWADPSLRQEALEREAQKRADDQLKREQAQRRKKAGTVKPASGASGQTKPTKPDRRTAIDMAMREHGMPLE